MFNTNKKLIKTYQDILKATSNARSIIASEMEKIDAKYAALAAKEKEELTKQAKQLDAQATLYNSFLSKVEAPEETVSEATDITKLEEEPVITDTIFPEVNSEVEQEIQNVEESEDVVEQTQNCEVTEEITAVTAESSVDTEKTEADEYKDPFDEDNWDDIEKESDNDSTSESDDWADVPEEWNN